MKAPEEKKDVLKETKETIEAFFNYKLEDLRPKKNTIKEHEPS